MKENILLQLGEEISLYHGVSYHIRKEKKPWQVSTTMNKRKIHIGYLNTEIEAAKAYNNFIIKNNLDRPRNEV